MQQFAFIIHPIDVRRDVARKYPIAKYLPERVIESVLAKKEPMAVAEIKGVHSIAGEEARGWFIACPLTARQLTTLPVDFVYNRLERCATIAQDLGAGIIGLGAFTSVVGDGGVTLAMRVPGIAVTTGNSYTVSTAIDGARAAGEMMGHHLPDANVAIVGANGSIGATCAEIMARTAKSVALIGRDEQRLNELAVALTPNPLSQVQERGLSTGASNLNAQRSTLNALPNAQRPTPSARIRVFTDVAAGLRDADIVITVTSAVDAVILPEHIKRGAVVCDVARPRDVSVRVSKERNDVLVIEGGLVRVPGDMRVNKMGRPGEPFSFGFPPGTAYACMSETMMLALDRRYESFTLGKTVSVEQVDAINEIAERHGFCIDGFRSFERAVDKDEIARIRLNAFGPK